jgi:hypothetical protein
MGQGFLKLLLCAATGNEAASEFAGEAVGDRGGSIGWFSRTTRDAFLSGRINRVGDITISSVADDLLRLFESSSLLTV